mmetsp:Transcript_5033/g.11437  ORF Transcript_5033/g.11437 Transcript_5033/m.11437 type:complete len:231 (+) Transcript_5033:30-722(+)
MAAPPPQGHRYGNMEEDEDDDGTAPDAVDECIEAEDGEDFLDIVDDFDGMDDDEGDLSFVSMGGENEDDDAFDTTIGALEEIIMDDEFQTMQEKFAEENCSHFDETDENKLIYTEIFAKYTGLVEGYLERRLQETLPGFSMVNFMEMLIAREEEMRASDVFDVLVSCTDFETFKEIMLSHKSQKNGSGIQLMVNIRPLAIHTDEETEGEARPDLTLSITPVSSPKRPLAA